MSNSDFLCFQKLKIHLANKLKETYPEVASDISHWKGNEIRLFQKDLENHVNGRISEKSFYTYFKTASKSIPRIDVLDLLCQYTGQGNWMSFKMKHNEKSFFKSSNRLWLGSVLVLCMIAVLTWLILPRKYTFSVIDAYSNQNIPGEKLKVIQIFEDQSPKALYESDENLYTLYSTEPQIQFIIEAPYFRRDTITRKVNIFHRQEEIRLFPNDYALVIHSLSKSKGEDWERRRDQLSIMFSDNARIFQIHKTGNIAIEMYNKDEFINKLTIPITSLKNIEIIDIKFENELISELRFIQEKGGSNE